MPWLALAFKDRQKKAGLCEKFGVSGIPKLVLFDATGKVSKHFCTMNAE